MSANFNEVFRGILTRAVGHEEIFTCSIEARVPDFEGSSGEDGISAPITGGVVEWAYLGLPATITGGSIEFFRPPSDPRDRQSIRYAFKFVAEGAVYVLRGEKRLTNLRLFDAGKSLSTLHSFVESSSSKIGSGELSCQLDELLISYEGVDIDGEPGVGELASMRRFHDFLNKKLVAVFPFLPPVLIASGREMPDGLRRTLKLLADVLLPIPLPANGPSIDDVVKDIEEFLGKASGTQVQQIRVLLEVISIFVPILTLALEELRKIVRAILDDENESLIRPTLLGIHQIVVFAYYSDGKADDLLGYSRPVHKPGHHTTLPVSATIPNRVFDVVIAGTGPAGALLADRLSAKGQSVLLLEAGPYVAEQDITTSEMDSIARLYKSSGLQTAKPSSITVLQGACVGGGGVINNGIFFPLSTATLKTWRDAGFPFSDSKMAEAYSAVACDLNIGDVKTKALRLNPAGAFLESKFGPLQSPPMGTVPPGFYRTLVNLETLVDDGEKYGCRSTGLCNLGCGSERKVNSFQYYLKNALNTGRDATLVPRATVIKAVMGSGGCSRRVQAFQVRMADGSEVLARGESFFLCCGPVASSGVLLRSEELLDAADGELPVGQRFSANVASPITATAPCDVSEQTYVQMCHVYVPEESANGFLIETWFSPPGGLALAMPGFLEPHAQRMSNYRRLMCASAVVGTHPRGSITLRGEDTAIDLPLAACDLDRFRRGTVLLLTAIMEAAPVFVRFGNGRTIRSMDDINALDAEMRCLKPADLNKLPLSTAHPQGGNALSEDKEKSVVGADFRFRGIENLRVCDGSVFPAVAGVNPQWTIFALAHLCAAGVE